MDTPSPWNGWSKAKLPATSSEFLRPLADLFLEDSDMIVDRKDGACRTCGSSLKIVDADDATMTVECIEWT